MWLKFWGKDSNKEEKSGVSAVVMASAEAITKIHEIGQFPLSILVIGVAVFIVALVMWKFVQEIGALLPWIIGFSSFLSIIAVVVYQIDMNRRRKMIERALDRYHELIARAFDKHIENFQSIDGDQFEGVINRLDRVYQRLTRPDKESKQQEANNKNSC